MDEEAASVVVPRVELLRDRGRPMVLRVAPPYGRTRHYVYVDNLGVIGDDQRVVQSTLDAMVVAFEDRGLKIHELATIWAYMFEGRNQ